MSTNSLAKKITGLSVVLVVLLGVAASMDDLLAAPVEETSDDETSGRIDAPSATADSAATPANVNADGLDGHGRDLNAEEAVFNSFINATIAPLIEQATKDLPELPEGWTRPVLKEEVFPEDEDDDIALYEDLFTVDGGGRIADKEEQDEFAKLFAKTMVDEPTAETQNAKVVNDKPTRSKTLKRAAKRTPARVKQTAKIKPSSAAKAASAAAQPARDENAPTKVAEPPPDTQPASGTPKELMAMAKKKLRSGNPKGAEVIYRQVLSKTPSNLRARYGLAKALYASNRVAFARKELGRVLAIRGSHGGALLMMGSILQSQGKKPAARNYYKKYLDTHPNGRRADEIRSILSRL